MLIATPELVAHVKEELDCSWQTADREAHRRLALQRIAEAYRETTDPIIEDLCDVLEWLATRS